LKCQICEGRYEEKLVARAYRKNGKVIVVDDVPVEVCAQCGDVLLKPETVELIHAALARAQQAEDFAPVVHLGTQAA
jgi:YgiT-type zinc finger domain-containing protein